MRGNLYWNSVPWKTYLVVGQGVEALIRSKCEFSAIQAFRSRYDQPLGTVTVGLAAQGTIERLENEGKNAFFAGLPQY